MAGVFTYIESNFAEKFRISGTNFVPRIFLESRLRILRYIDVLDLPCDGFVVHYVDVLYRVIWQCYLRSRMSAQLVKWITKL